jgi:WD40 repeat protein
MTSPSTDAASLTDRVTDIAAGAPVVFATFLGRDPGFALADGTILIAGVGAETRVDPHPDAAILCAASDGARLLTGGDDGRVVATDASGAMENVAREKSWIDALAARGDGALAWSSGRAVTARDARGETKTLATPSSVRGLAFFPKGYRLAASHYNGASLWFPNIVGEPDSVTWKGSHLDCAVSPDGKYVVTSMQENALHGWRLADKKDMRMTGYPAKTRSFSWSHDGLWLATSGAEAAIVWPFAGKDGPMGKPPRECGVRPVRVTCVAFHPDALIVAIGYADGWILLVRLTDASELLVRRTRAEDKAKAIASMAWDANGKRLVFGADDGAAGVLSLPTK